MGADNARRSVLQRLDGPLPLPSLVLTCGFAGGLDPALPPPAVVNDSDPEAGLSATLASVGSVPVRFHCAPRIAITSAEKAELRLNTGADAVEMESNVIRRLCRERGLPAATVRVISDAAGDDMPVDFNQLVSPDMRLQFGRLAAHLLRNPRALPGLLRLRRHTLDAARRLAAVLATPATAHQLATVQARLALDRAARCAPAERAPWLGPARAALAAAARACPGSAAAWIQRARLAALDPDADPAAAGIALARALHWAPAWPSGLRTALRLLVHPRTGPAVSDGLASAIADASLAGIRPPAPWAFAVLGQRLGTARVVDALAAADPALRASAYPWLRQYGDLSTWMAARRDAAVRWPPRVAPGQALAADALLGVWALDLAPTAAARRAQAAGLVDAGLPMPAALAAAIVADSPAGQVLIDGADLRDPAARAQARALLVPLGEAWSARRLTVANAVERALRGDAGMARDIPPDLALALADDVTAALTAPQRDALRLGVDRHRQPGWQSLPGVRWTWLVLDAGSRPLRMTVPARVGLVIDGAWRGWIMGDLDLGAFAGPGLQRIALIDPP